MRYTGEMSRQHIARGDFGIPINRFYSMGRLKFIPSIPMHKPARIWNGGLSGLLEQRDKCKTIGMIYPLSMQEVLGMRRQS